MTPGRPPPIAVVHIELDQSRPLQWSPALADQVVALGWKAELGEPGRQGTPIDVVVEEL